ncbi:MAG: LptF/LptG family permease [Bacteroidota bacterium]
MKILDRYILFSFLKVFFSVLVILVLIFMLQAIWMFISDFAGKDIEVVVIAKFLFYYLPYQMPLFLPLTILVASIMTFGKFSENYEFAAMKSAGISLQRAMKSLIFFIVLLAYATFLFSNTIIPWAEFKAINLKNNIAKVKPAMAILEGVFTEIGDYNIKVDKKTGDNDQFLHNVIIHKKEKRHSGNYTVIKSDSGELASEENSNLLKLILFDGNYYDEIRPKNQSDRRRLPFVKSEFDEYTINIDLSQFNDVDLDDESATHPYRMLNVKELRVQVDSFSRAMNNSNIRYNKNITQRNGFTRYANNQGENESAASIDGNVLPQLPQHNQKTTIPFLNPEKSANKKSNDSSIDRTRIGRTKLANLSNSIDLDSIKSNQEEIKSIAGTTDVNELISIYEEREQSQIYSRALSSINSIIPQVQNESNKFKNKFALLNKTEMQLHKKYALAVACVILFFVGAPLGAIIRKGGMGLPLIFAIILFLIYHFIGIFAQNSAETGKISPFLGAWISTFIMLPLGIYLTYKATTDQGFVKLDFLTEPIRKLLIKLKLNKFKTRE